MDLGVDVRCRQDADTLVRVNQNIKL